MTTIMSSAEQQWRAGLSRTFSGLVPGHVAHSRPSGEMQSIGLGRVAAYEIRGTPQLMRRLGTTARFNPSGALKICLMTRGVAILQQGRRELSVARGQLVLYDQDLPYALRFDDQWSCLVMTFPRESLGLTPRAVEDSMERPHDALAGPGALLTTFIKAALVQAAVQPESAMPLGDAGLNILTATLIAADRSLHSSSDLLRQQVVAYVHTHIKDPNLNVATVAAAHHVSVRTVQRLFENYGCTLHELIRAERLSGVYRDLADPGLAGSKISALAARWGFSDAPSFARTFRLTYGITPTEVRVHGRSV